MDDMCLCPARGMVRLVGVAKEGAVVVTILECANVFAQAFFKSSARLPIICLFAAVVATGDLVDDAVLRGVACTGCLDHFPDLGLGWGGDSQMLAQMCFQLLRERRVGNHNDGSSVESTTRWSR